jgi:cathepsin F
MKTLLLFLAVVFAGSETLIQQRNQFSEFVSTFGKQYPSPQEYNYRFQVFRQNLQKLEEYSRLDPNHPFGITKFADMTKEEFKANFLLPSRVYNISQPPITVSNLGNFSWWDLNKVGPVKNQMANSTCCPTCWAFATTGVIESRFAIKYNSLILPLSEQELISCGKLCPFKDLTCNFNNAAQDILINIPTKPSVMTEDYFPYDPIHTTTCKVQKLNPVGGSISSYTSISTDENVIAEEVMKNGPVAAAINAEYLQLYQAGIISDPFLCSNKVDHGVVIIGYGTSTQTHTGGEIPFWSIKNSYGSDWGETADCNKQNCPSHIKSCQACMTPGKRGYFRLRRGAGKCGINTNVVALVI